MPPTPPPIKIGKIDVHDVYEGHMNGVKGSNSASSISYRIGSPVLTGPTRVYLVVSIDTYLILFHTFHSTYSIMEIGMATK